MRNSFFSFVAFFLLLAPASAGTITRDVRFLDYNILEITLTPSPYKDFSLPGYFVTEYLPSGMQFLGTNAEWYELNNFKLSMLRFNPPENNATLKYKLKALSSATNTSYIIYGVFKDKNRNIGQISPQSITLTSTPTFTTYPTPTPNPTESKLYVLSDETISNPVNITANQTQPLEQKKIGDWYIYFIAIGSLIPAVFLILTFKKPILNKIDKLKANYIIYEIVGDD